MLPVTSPLGCCCDGAACEPPSIAPILDVTVCEGDTISVPSTVTGTAPLLYQWYKGNVGDTSNPIAGANGPILEIVGATPGNAGVYWLQVQNPCGNANSNEFNIFVGAAPTATIAPPPPGPYPSGTTLTVTAFGVGPFTYAWQSGPTALGPFAPTGDIGDSITPPVVVDTWFVCIVSNACGDFTTPPVLIQGAPPPEP